MATKWSVPRAWEGETVAVLASGPTMTRDTAEYVRGKCRAIAVNNQGIDTLNGNVMEAALAPWADVLYAADSKWWDYYKDRALKFQGYKVTIRNIVTYPEVLALEHSTKEPFDPRPTHMYSGGNSGYQAVHLAAHFGVRRIILLGYDMRAIGDRKHWFGDHPGKLNTPQRYVNWISSMCKLYKHLTAMGIEVVNCTPRSAIKCIPNRPLKEVL